MHALAPRNAELCLYLGGETNANRKQQKQIEALSQKVPTSPTKLTNKQKLMKKILVVLLACVPVLFMGCKKNENESYIPVSKALLAAFSYKPGTYWVYRDSISGRIDSFYVLKNWFNTYVNTKQFTRTEFNDIYIVQKNIDNTIADTTLWEFILSHDSSIQCGCGEGMFYRLVPFPFSSGYFFPGQNLYSDTTAIFINKSLSMNGFNFLNLAEVHHSFYPTGNSNDVFDFEHYDIFYINTEQGIVKMKLNHPKASIYNIWELVRYKVVK